VRKISKRVTVGLAVGVGAMLCKPALAFAGTITTPNTNPFNVPSSGGNPQPFNIVATGFNPGQQVFAMQCDGTSPTAPGWSPTVNCDIATSNAPAIADGSGQVTFPASDINLRFQPFKGDSPQGLFNCIAPGQTPPANGLPTYSNCQLRVASNVVSPTLDQAFLTLKLASK
jgi:hypothetical protein